MDATLERLFTLFGNLEKELKYLSSYQLADVVLDQRISYYSQQVEQFL